METGIDVWRFDLGIRNADLHCPRSVFAGESSIPAREGEGDLGHWKEAREFISEGKEFSIVFLRVDLNCSLDVSQQLLKSVESMQLGVYFALTECLLSLLMVLHL